MSHTETAPAPDAPAAAPASLRWSEWLVVIGAGVLLVIVSSQFSALYWSPRAALLLVAMGPGIVALALAVRAGDRAAIAGLAFIGVAALSVVVSPAPALSLLGPYNLGGGWLFVVSVVTAWALGRRLSAVAARRLGDVVVIAAALNAVMAWLQVSRLFHVTGFRPIAGRAQGLMGNPVHLTGLMVGATALIATRFIASRRGRDRADGRAWDSADSVALGLAFLFASAVQFSGGRIGVVLLAVVVGLVAVRAGLRAAVPFALVLVLGVVLAGAAVSADGTGATERLDAGSGSLSSQRLDRWAMAVDAVRDRPFLGIGPSLYRRATSPYNTVPAARAFGPDLLNQEAHNLFVEYATTTGLFGVAALIAWLVLASRRARGELAAFALIGGLSLLVQPVWIGLTPVLALALGAADRRPSVPYGRTGTVAVALLTSVGLVTGALLLRHDARLADGYRAGDPVAVAAAADALSVWPDTAAASAALWAHPVPGSGRRPDWRRALAAEREAIRRDPSDPVLRVTRADDEREHGSRAVARAEYLAALRWDPFSVKAMLGLATLDQQDGDTRSATRRCEAARVLVPRLSCRVFLAAVDP